MDKPWTSDAQAQPQAQAKTRKSARGNPYTSCHAVIANKRLCNGILERSRRLQLRWLKIDEVTVHELEERLTATIPSWVGGRPMCSRVAWIELLSVVVTLVSAAMKLLKIQMMQER